MQEFDIIEKFFTQQTVTRDDVIFGVGDDAAILRPPANQELLMTVDTLVKDVHFAADTKPFDVGYKSLAVNLSDLAAMGAEPAWATLALTLPESDPAWLFQFATGFFQLAKEFNVVLVGGDTTRGPLSITVQVTGFAPINKALRRNGAKAGDLIFVTGALGDAALAYEMLGKDLPLPPKGADYLLQRLHRPYPRIKEGLLLRDVAHSAIDISDGLIADLGHILKQSKVGATIAVDETPLSQTMQQVANDVDWIVQALTFGDDYELCFTVDPKLRNKISELLPEARCVGEITAKAGLELRRGNGKLIELDRTGYKHFE